MKVDILGMNNPSFFQKTFILLSVLFLGINPALANEGQDFFPLATATEFAVDISVPDTVQTLEYVISNRILIPEPVVRVGLYKTSEVIKFKSEFTYEVWVGGVSRGVISAGNVAELSYKKGLYTIKSESLEFGSFDYFRLVPANQANFFSLVNYSRPVAGRKKINFNVYRGTLEYRYSPKSKLPYIINELPLDSYVNGIAETHDSAAIEYSKALSVAARSYAYAFIGKTPPTEKRMFDVYATTVDQLYLGYNSELFMPRYAEAATATAGEMVTYNREPVVVFYFSRSNGKTKSWKGKDRPWLKSVEAKYDKGKKMLGHGIGMSNADAQQRAAKDGWEYKQILEHYYTSTTVEKVF